MKHWQVRGVAVAVVVAIVALRISATTYYVSPIGNDTNDGKSWVTAVATVTKGISLASGTKGSELVISNGVYRLSGASGCTGGTSEALRTVIRGFTGNPDDVVLDAGGEFECIRLAGHVLVASLTVSNGINRAGCAAGGIRLNGSAASGGRYSCIISNCVVTCCTNVLGVNANGAAVLIGSNDLLVDSVIRNNTATDWRGAGVLVSYPANSTGEPPVIRRCRIEGNVAAQSGGGIYVTGGGNRDVIIEDCEIVGNSCGQGGAGMFCTDNLNICLTRCVVSNNMASIGGGYGGGGMRQQKGRLSLTDCLVANNAASNGAGIDIVPSAAGLEFCGTNTVFRGNVAKSCGGAMRIYQDAQAFVAGCRFEGNQKTTKSNSNLDDGGGGLWLAGQGSGSRGYGYCSVSNCVFACNASNGRGGGMGCTWNTNFCGAVVNCVFTNNTSYYQGGGLCIREVAANPTPAIIRNCLFAHNETIHEGSGAENDTVDSNGGGILFVTRSDVTIENCTIVSNNIRHMNTAYKSGGIHHRWGGKLKNCIVAFNTARGEPEDNSYWTLNDGAYVNCCGYPEVARFKAANGCIAADPKFVDPAHGDFSLQPSSPCRNAGQNADWMAMSTDLASNPRIGEDRVDIGCLEYKPFSGMEIIIK